MPPCVGTARRTPVCTYHMFGGSDWEGVVFVVQPGALL